MMMSIFQQLDACVWAKAFYIPALDIRVAGVAKWQTRQTQNLVVAIP
jgi:hypothetical protein